MSGPWADDRLKDRSQTIWQTCREIVQTCCVVMQLAQGIRRSTSPSEKTSDGISAVIQESPDKSPEYAFAAHCLQASVHCVQLAPLSLFRFRPFVGDRWS